MIDLNTQIELVDPNAGIPYELGYRLSNAYIDVSCSADELTNICQVRDMMKQHGMNLEFYAETIPGLIKLDLVRLKGNKL